MNLSVLIFDAAQSVWAKGDLPIFTVYDRPRDYPAHVVVRLHVVQRGVTFATDRFWLFKTIEEAVGAMPEGLHRLMRDPGDDPPIVETWI